MKQAFWKQLLVEFVLPLAFISLFFGLAAVWPLDGLVPSTKMTQSETEQRKDGDGKNQRQLAGKVPSAEVTGAAVQMNGKGAVLQR